MMINVEVWAYALYPSITYTYVGKTVSLSVQVQRCRMDTSKRLGPSDKIGLQQPNNLLGIIIVIG